MGLIGGLSVEGGVYVFELFADRKGRDVGHDL